MLLVLDLILVLDFGNASLSCLTEVDYSSGSGSSWCRMYISILKSMTFYCSLAFTEVNESETNKNMEISRTYLERISRNQYFCNSQAISCQFTRDITDLTYSAYLKLM